MNEIEIKIGGVFKRNNGKTYVCEEYLDDPKSYRCGGCSLSTHKEACYTVACAGFRRSDKKTVIFVRNRADKKKPTNNCSVVFSGGETKFMLNDECIVSSFDVSQRIVLQVADGVSNVLGVKLKIVIEDVSV